MKRKPDETTLLILVQFYRKLSERIRKKRKQEKADLYHTQSTL